MLSDPSLDIVRGAAELHIRLSTEILRLVSESEKSGEPIIRAFEYEYPNCGFECVTDEFLLGSDILVAPVTEKGARERKVVFPSGKWAGADGTVYEGGEYTVSAPLEVLPWFKKF